MSWSIRGQAVLYQAPDSFREWRLVQLLRCPMLDRRPQLT
jgi:hypothetical protein